MSFQDFKTKRPAKNHPDVKYWEELRKSIIEEQGNECATCPATSDDYPLDLHHRHYDNFGAENKKDVVILCRPCHDAITNRLRMVREKDEIIHESAPKITVEKGIITYEKPRF